MSPTERGPQTPAAAADTKSGAREDHPHRAPAVPRGNSKALAILLHGLIDDGGLFPPAPLPMRQAVERYRADRTVGHPMHTGRLLCPRKALPELYAHLGADEQIAVGLVEEQVEEIAHAAPVDPRVHITHYEIRASWSEVGKTVRYLRAMTFPTAGRRRLWGRRARTGGEAAHVRPIFIEFDRSREGLDSIAGLAGVPHAGARLRCSGATEDDFPRPEEVAEFLVRCFDHDVPFRLSAGPHHAVRHTDPLSGFAHLGYLNLLAGAAVAAHDGGPNKVLRALVITDLQRLLERIYAIGEETALRIRELFRGYGARSTRDPVVEAEQLGLVTPPAAGAGWTA
ncbi:MAG UNVERIFIED_CONTAM: hypothetical protein LOD86_01325 [Thermobifida fusca]